MKNDALALQRIADAIDKIERYLIEKTIQDFTQDTQLQDSVLMNLVVIGGETNRIADSYREQHPEIPWHEMIGMRNVISHDYFSIKPEIIWQTAQRDLPALRQQLDSLL